MGLYLLKIASKAIELVDMILRDGDAADTFTKFLNTNLNFKR